ncbi:M16 family metallopeptidase [Gemmatimonas sp.]|uniref:M16 family metallopeptidase n=1 Tax=Gemmatimonas sp. TaxID=1962908 RepID=UPI003DA51AC8
MSASILRRACLGLALAVQLAPLSAQKAPTIPHEKYTLPNGLEVILHVDRSVPIVAVENFYKVGSGDEKVGRTGFAHLFEHVMFMGSENVPVGKFDEWLEAAGRQQQRLNDLRPHQLLRDGSRRMRCPSCSGSTPIAWGGSCPPWIRANSTCSATS